MTEPSSSGSPFRRADHSESPEEESKLYPLLNGLRRLLMLLNMFEFPEENLKITAATLKRKIVRVLDIYSYDHTDPTILFQNVSMEQYRITTMSDCVTILSNYRELGEYIRSSYSFAMNETKKEVTRLKSLLSVRKEGSLFRTIFKKHLHKANINYSKDTPSSKIYRIEEDLYEN